MIDDTDSDYLIIDHTSDETNQPSEASSDGPGCTDTDKRTRNAFLRLQNFHWDSFHLMDIIGTGRNGVVYQAYFRNERMAINIWQSRAYHEDMLTDTGTYFALSELT